MKKNDLEVGVPYAYAPSRHGVGQRALLVAVGQLWMRGYSNFKREVTFLPMAHRDRPEGRVGYLAVIEQGAWDKGAPLPELPPLEPDALSKWSHPDWHLVTLNNRHLTGPWGEYMQEVQREIEERDKAEQERRRQIETARDRFGAARATIRVHADIKGADAWDLNLRYPLTPDVELSLQDLEAIAAALNDLTGELHRMRGSEDA